MSSADGTAPVDTEAYNVESVIVIGMSCCCKCIFGFVHYAFVNEGPEIFHRQTTLNYRSSFLIQTRIGFILAFGPKSATFTCKQRRRLHTVCCKRFSWLEFGGQRVTDCIQKVLGATHASHVFMHSATRGPPPSPSNVCSRLLSSPWVLEHQVRLPPSSRSQARP